MAYLIFLFCRVYIFILCYTEVKSLIKPMPLSSTSMKRHFTCRHCEETSLLGYGLIYNLRKTESHKEFTL